MKTSPVPPKETPTGDASSLVNLGYISVDYPEDLPLAEEAMRLRDVITCSTAVYATLADEVLKVKGNSRSNYDHPESSSSSSGQLQTT